ncbi:hypothetical protein GCM10008904_00410 [Paraclostridium ghonii]|uniref:Glycopeptide antibiotics resistance protein n=1 Tax=Paraclostridium ghonii TaxID=29358 RepID=A0ABU0MY65_9FIRM|nr:VanZ family protein [Paeniclostridium ghonii]MDQ0555856.1 glycopeptide antibiotics resistance protein [Paeniclostridium ghonii]
MRGFKLKKYINYKQILNIIFLIYLLILIKIILFKTNSFIDLLKGNTSAGYRGANLMPFKTIFTFFDTTKHFSFLRAISNTLGNIAIFLPLGYLLPILTKKINNIYKVFLVSILVSIAFESLQYIFYLGSLDIDDVILNTLGGVIGYIIYYFIKKLTITYDSTTIYKVSIVLSVVSFIIGVPIAKTEFGNILGLTTYETLYINKDVIPNKDADIRGTYISKEDDCLKIYNSIIDKDSQEKDFLKEKLIPIDKNTKFYYYKIKELKNKAEIEYVPLNIDELNKIEEYSLISVWEKEENNKIILFSDGLDSNTKISNTKSEDKSNSSSENLNLSGDIKDISENSIKVNIAIQKDMENGKTSSVSKSINSVSTDENDNSKEILFNDKTKFKLKEEGKDEKNINLADVKPGDSVNIIYTKNDDKFMAKTITICK